MEILAKIAMAVSFVLTVASVFSPRFTLFWFRGEPSVKNGLLLYGGIFLMLFVVMTRPHGNESTLEPISVDKLQTHDTISVTYRYLSEKVSSDGKSKMHLYCMKDAKAPIEISELKAICYNNRESFRLPGFYFLVVFDQSEHAVYPSTPFTSYYGTQESTMRHIKAIYTYNHQNDFSQLLIYQPNMLNGVSEAY